MSESESPKTEYESDASVYRLLAAIFFIALIGVYALDHWYQGNLRAEMRAKEAEFAQANERLAAMSTDIEAAGASEARLKSELDALQS